MIILERLAGDCAVIYEDDNRKTVPASLVRTDKAGTVLYFKDGFYLPDPAATSRRRQDIIDLQNSLWEEP